VSVPYISEARRPANKRPPSGTFKEKQTASSESLLARFHRATRDELIEVAREIGPGKIWDEMIIPVIG
jgi:hypothetical protein